MAHSSTLPTIDLSAFLKQEDDEDGWKKAMKDIHEACSEYGFFLAVNHGVPLQLMSQALQVSKSFFDLPDEDKLDYSLKPAAATPPIDGSSTHSGSRTGIIIESPQGDKFEYALRLALGASNNKAEYVALLVEAKLALAYNDSQLVVNQVLEEMYPYFTKLGSLVENIINDCLGLPPDFLKEYNDDRSLDFIIALHYFPATETDNVGKACHSDGNSITFVFSDGVEGLQVYKDGEWISICPPEGTLVVNIGDIIQVLSNDKLKSAAHRVVRQLGKSRYSYAFLYTIPGDKLVEPLPHFTVNKGDSPKYKGFLYKEYVQLRVRNVTRPQDRVGIAHYEISKS
ncbi:hypothetical protein BUALT_Bualt07G0055700 [Buddleja alternifolia]|uniref:Fe2OG dioxygenase domain-containing protein n=1 Tax=Buddleja alternifolia TaxID=168488 RepID=A0AAV6XF41_9LAMI|nr:hypothetical protein BUALT_Bualt07G0055700 [Buddleja alternifolia]